AVAERVVGPALLEACGVLDRRFHRDPPSLEEPVTAGGDLLRGLVELEHQDGALRELARPSELRIRRGTQVDVMELARSVLRRAFRVGEDEGRADERPLLVALG